MSISLSLQLSLPEATFWANPTATILLFLGPCTQASLLRCLTFLKILT